MIPTVSLETAILLKENGFRQDISELFWEYIPQILKPKVFSAIVTNRPNVDNEYYAAPTTDDLLAKLPHHIKYKGNGSSDLLITKGSKNYSVRYMASYCFPHRTKAYCQALFTRELLPEALALMWIHLKKEDCYDKK